MNLYTHSINSIMNIINHYRLACLVAVAFAAGQAMAEVVQVGNLYYDVDQETKTATVARNVAYKELTSLNVPGKVTVDNAEYRVTKIAQQAFQECTGLTTVAIGEGVEEVGKWTFYKCTGISSLTLPSTLVTVEQSAFSGCTSIEMLVLPDNLTTIKSYGFGKCTSLKELTLPANLKILDGSAFSGNTGLKKINFGPLLETIANNTFYDCGIEILELPASLTTLGNGAFSRCNQLTTVKLPASLKTIGEQVFYCDGALKNVEFNAGLETIGNGAFYECLSLQSVALPDGIKSIEDNAFYGTGLTSIQWPESLTSISNNMFYNCVNLSDVKLHEGITSIGKMVFRNCASLKSIKLPSKLTVISDNLFDRCSSLESFDIPDHIVSVGENAFYQCTGLRELNVPASVTSIGSGFILGCSSLTRVNVAADNPNYADVDGVFMNKDKTVLLAYPSGIVGEYVMPESVTEISEYCFNQNNNITGITFSKNLKRIGLSAFAMCMQIKELNFPDGLEYIGDMAFFLARGVSKIHLPNNDVFIGNNALSMLAIEPIVFPETIRTIGIAESGNTSVMGSCGSLQWLSLPSTLKELSPLASGCNSLKAIYSFAVEPPVLKGNNVVDIAAVVKVPSGTADAYAQAWSDLYPNLTYEEALPGAASVTVNGNAATVNWETYSDGLYTGTPVRYSIVLDNGSSTEESTLEGVAATGRNLSYTFANLSNKTYTYSIKGYSAQNELTVLHTGQFDIATSGIDDVEAAGEAVSVEYFDLTGRQVAKPAANTLYVVRTVYSDGTVVTAKQLVK